MVEYTELKNTKYGILSSFAYCGNFFKPSTVLDSYEWAFYRYIGFQYLFTLKIELFVNFPDPITAERSCIEFPR